MHALTVEPVRRPVDETKTELRLDAPRNLKHSRGVNRALANRVMKRPTFSSSV